MDKYFNFEIYTSDPITKTSGWDITSVSVKAEIKKDAILKLNEYPNFDTIILYNFEHMENETSDFLVTELYPDFKTIDRLDRITFETIVDALQEGKKVYWKDSYEVSKRYNSTIDEIELLVKTPNGSLTYLQDEMFKDLTIK